MPNPNEMNPFETPEQKAAREESQARILEMFGPMVVGPDAVRGIINASTKPGYDPLNCLGGFMPTPKTPK